MSQRLRYGCCESSRLPRVSGPQGGTITAVRCRQLFAKGTKNMNLDDVLAAVKTAEVALAGADSADQSAATQLAAATTAKATTAQADADAATAYNAAVDAAVAALTASKR